MPDKLDEGILYYRAKGDAIGSVIVGAILVVFAWIVLTQDGFWGIPFSKDLTVMSTYLALPLGIVLFLANLPHALARGPTLAAGEDGITILFTPRPVGLIRWTEINEFVSFKHQGKWYLGIVLETPEDTLMPFKGNLAALFKRFGPPGVHLKIHSRMLDDDINTVLRDLQEMRHVRSWRG